MQNVETSECEPRFVELQVLLRKDIIWCLTSGFHVCNNKCKLHHWILGRRIYSWLRCESRASIVVSNNVQGQLGFYVETFDFNVPSKQFLKCFLYSDFILVCHGQLFARDIEVVHMWYSQLVYSACHYQSVYCRNAQLAARCSQIPYLPFCLCDLWCLTLGLNCLDS